MALLAIFVGVPEVAEVVEKVEEAEVAAAAIGPIVVVVGKSKIGMKLMLRAAEVLSSSHTFPHRLEMVVAPKPTAFE